MKIATWNVNSIRSRLPQVLTWLDDVKPELLCLQETKVDDPFFPQEEFASRGYHFSFHGQKAYNGVALISMLPLEDVRKGFIGELPTNKEAAILSEQKRVISSLVGGIRVVNVYVPNGSELNSEKYSYKIKWLNCLDHYLKVQAKRDEPICLLGDFNIALEARDIHNPQKLSGGIMASDQERSALINVLGERLTDVFRVFEPDTNHWSWWDYRSGAWDRDKGWRIDHIYLSEELIMQAKNCIIDKKTRGNSKPSDHAPVIVEISWPQIDEDEDEDEDEDILELFNY